MKYLLIPAIIFILSCQGRNTYNLYREGIISGTLHVYVSDYYAVESETRNKPIDFLVLENAKSRATLLLASYISMNIKPESVSRPNDRILNRSINNSLKSGRIKLLECNDNNYCTAQVIFDAKPVFVSLKRINSDTTK